MEEGIGLLSPLIIMLFVVGVVIPASVRQRNKKREAFEAVARKRGLAYQQGGWFKADDVVGVIDGLDVHLDTYTTSQGKSQTHWTRVRVRVRLPAGLKIGREHLLHKLAAADLQTGDPTFDDKVRIHGADDEALAVLDARTRSAVVDVLSRVPHLKIADDEIVWQRPTMLTEQIKLERALDDALDLARGLRLVAEPVAGLLQRLRSDPEPGVRARALEILAGRATNAELIAAAEQGWSDPSPDVQRLAGRLKLRLAPDVGRPALRPYLESRLAEDLLAALTEVRRRKVPVEDLVLPALSHRDDEVKLAAVQALAVIGGRDAVAPLLPLTRGALTSPRLRGAARAAVKTVQSRLGALGDRGGLALTGSGGGELALAASGGELSEVERPEGGEATDERSAQARAARAARPSKGRG